MGSIIKFLLICFTLLFVPFFSYTANEVPMPRVKNPVIDNANLLNEAQKERINNILWSVYYTGKIQMGIYIIRSLDGQNIEAYSMNVAETWQLGRKGKDEGLLLFIALDDKKARLEVGYGLEGILPDGYCGKILRAYLVPYFKKKRYADGILVLIEEICKKLEIHNITADVEKRLKPQNWRNINFMLYIYLLILAGMLIAGFYFLYVSQSAIIVKRGKYGKYIYSTRSAGGFSGGSRGSSGGYSGGGGGFGGGGASASW